MKSRFDQSVEVVSARLADYHIFQLSGKHLVENGATGRFSAITTEEPMPLEVLYRIQQGQSHLVQKIYRFINNEDHHLPKDGPLPDGLWHVFTITDEATQSLSYRGSTRSAYVPPNQKVELQLGHDPAIAVEETYLGRVETQHRYNSDNYVTGWVDHRSYTFSLHNTRSIPISIEYLIPATGDWEIFNLKGERRSNYQFRHLATVQPGNSWELGPYTVSTRQGDYANRDIQSGRIMIAPVLPTSLVDLEIIK